MVEGLSYSEVATAYIILATWVVDAGGALMAH